MKNDYDVVIIGAGPAGASAAYYSKLFDENHAKKILLIESLKEDSYNRYHYMCGEVVSKYIHKDFPKMNLSSFILNKIDTFVEFYGDETIIRSPLAGYVLDRPKFLSYLLEQYRKQGGIVLHDKLLDYKESSKKIELNLEQNGRITTKYLILASGPKRPKSKKQEIVGDVFSSLLYQIVIKDYPLEKNTIEFYYDEKYKENYKWIFPYGDLIKIGVPFENKKELDQYHKYEIIRKDSKPVCCGVLEKYFENNTLFIGDAAYQNNPLTKGGIRNAINAAKMASEAVIKYDNPEHYDTMWKKSRFFTQIYLDACKQLRTMNNKELIHQSKPLKYYPFSIPLIHLKYRKYLPLYKAYISSGKFGW